MFKTRVAAEKCFPSTLGKWRSKEGQRKSIGKSVSSTFSLLAYGIHDLAGTGTIKYLAACYRRIFAAWVDHFSEFCGLVFHSKKKKEQKHIHKKDLHTA